MVCLSNEECRKSHEEGDLPMQLFQLSMPAEQRTLGLSGVSGSPASLTELYRPRRLPEMVGQGSVVWRLQDFLEAPHSAAFLFEGPTGVGKTTAALCLAAELGAVEYGGLEQIRSGMQDGEAVERALESLRYTPMLGSGWKVLIVDEADYMSPKAAQLWLSALEDLPPRSLIVFTTNRPEKFADRFLDRCERFQFESDAEMLGVDAQVLADSIWWRETGREDAPEVSGLPGIRDDSGAISFRRVVRALEPLLRKARRNPQYPARAEFGGVLAERLASDPDTVPRAIRERDRAFLESKGVVSPGDPAPKLSWDHPLAHSTGQEGVDFREPCCDCGTTGGAKTASGKIERTKGRCQRCYNRFRRQPGVKDGAR